MIRFTESLRDDLRSAITAEWPDVEDAEYRDRHHQALDALPLDSDVSDWPDDEDESNNWTAQQAVASLVSYFYGNTVPTSLT